MVRHGVIRKKFQSIFCGALLAFSTLQLKAEEELNTGGETDTSPTTEQVESTDATAHESTEKPSKSSTVVGEGKTLPARVLRARVYYQQTLGSKSFDKDSKKVETGMTLEASGGAFVLEYGITDDLSLQVLQKYVASAKWKLDDAKFKESAIFKQKVDKYKKTIADTLFPGADEATLKQSFAAPLSQVLQGLKANPATKPIAEALEANGYTVPETGETITLSDKLDKSLDEILGDLVTGGAKPSDGGGFRLGDLEVGALYSIFNDRRQLLDGKLHLSAGLGLRIPVGKHPTASGIIPSGAGIWDLGLRVNLDFYLHEYFVLAWQNQSEIMLVKGKYKKTSLLDNQKLNEGTPADDEAANEVDFKKKGLAQKGFLQASWGLGMLNRSMDAFSFTGRFYYRIDREDDYKGIDKSDTIGTGGNSTSWEVTGNFNGLSYKVPLQLELSYTAPITGKSQIFSASAFQAALKFYYKF